MLSNLLCEVYRSSAGLQHLGPCSTYSNCAFSCSFRTASMLQLSLQDNIQKTLFQRATYAKLFCHLSVYDIGKTHGRLSTSFPFSKQSMLKILQQLRCMLSN